MSKKAWLKKYCHQWHADAQPFDRIAVETVPRYKTSDASGCEWRFRVVTSFYWKGQKVGETAHGSALEAANNMRADWNSCLHSREEGDVPMCDQEGCDQEATVFYELKDAHCTPCGTARESIFSYVRWFCQAHSTRGDCGIDDADPNYTLLQGTPASPPESAVSVAGKIFL